MSFLVTGKHDLDLTLLLPTQRNRLWQRRGGGGDFPNPRPGRFAEVHPDHRCQFGSTG